MSGLGGLIFGLPLILVVCALFLFFRGERIRREQRLSPSTPRPLVILYQLIAIAIIALVAYLVFMSLSSAIEQGVI